MSAEALRINTTRLRRFHRCEYEWFAYAVQGVEAMRPLPSANRDRGKAFHALLECALVNYAETGEVFDYSGDAGRDVAAWELARLHEDDGTDLDEATCYELLDAARYQIKALNLAQWEVVTLADGTPLIEADLKAPHPMLPDIQLQAKVDVVLRHRVTGKIWLIDFKTTAFPISDVPPWIECNDQLAFGRAVLAAHGIDVDFSALLHLRSRAPEPPPLVNVGKKNERTTYSASALSCDWETYRKTLIERGEDPSSATALKVKDALAVQRFSLWQVDITDETQHAATMQNITRAAMRMRDIVRGDAKPVRRLITNHHRGSCSACDYGAWCTAAMRNGGSDDLTMLGSMYKARDWSPYAGHGLTGALVNPAAAYMHWAAKHGRRVSPTQEFTPAEPQP